MENPENESYEELNAKLAKKFPKIVEIGRAMHSYNYYINNQMEQAETDGAPSNATYKRGGTWQTDCNSTK